MSASLLIMVGASAPASQLPLAPSEARVGDSRLVQRFLGCGRILLFRGLRGRCPRLFRGRRASGRPKAVLHHTTDGTPLHAVCSSSPARATAETRLLLLLGLRLLLLLICLELLEGLHTTPTNIYRGVWGKGVLLSANSKARSRPSEDLKVDARLVVLPVQVLVDEEVSHRPIILVANITALGLTALS